MGAMAQLPESPEAVCNWFQQRWDFESLPEVNKIIDDTLHQFKESARSKFPGVEDYLKMAEARFQDDVSRFLVGPVGYIFNCDGTGNFYDYVSSSRLSESTKNKCEKEAGQAPSLQKHA